jgi:ribosomal protein L29
MALAFVTTNFKAPKELRMMTDEEFRVQVRELLDL